MTGPVWGDGTWTGLPSLLDEVSADVCVVGLGGSGLTAIQELRVRGASVVGVDAGAVGGGAAGRNGGFLLAGGVDPHHLAAAALGRERAVALYVATLEELARVERATPSAVRRTGSLRIERTEEGLADCAEQLRSMRADGLDVEEYDGPEGTGLLFRHDAVVQPLLRCRSMASGPGLYERSPVVSVSSGLVTTDRGAVRCGAVIVAVDGRLSDLLPEVPVRTVRLQMLATSPVPQRFSRPVYLRDGYEYWQQLPDGRIALGGFRDVGGDLEETTSTEPGGPVQDALTRFLREDLEIQAEITHRWAASVGYTQDRQPYVAQVRDRVWAAGGYCGTGNLVGALAGRQLAAEALGVPADFWPLRS